MAFQKIYKWERASEDDRPLLKSNSKSNQNAKIIIILKYVGKSRR